LMKIEAMNPTGCVKSRIAAYMVERAEAEGKLKPGGTIVECTSGNTGVGLCTIAAVKGYRAVIVMPDKMSQEKVDMLKAYGAEVVLTPTAVPPEHPDHYLNTAQRLAAEIPGAWHADQFENPNNPESHYLSTGPEIWQATEGQLHAFVGGCGTGGTVSGIARYLKEQDESVRIIGVDPPGSVYAGYWQTGEVPAAGPYAVEGVGDDMIPGTWHGKLIDGYEVVEDADSFAMTRRLAEECGLFVGGSSGMAMVAALRQARKMKKGERLLVLLPDSGNRYLSKVYSNDWLKDGGFLPKTDAATATTADLARNRARAAVAADENLMVAYKHVAERMVHPLPVFDGKPDAAKSKLIGVLDVSAVCQKLADGADLQSMQVSDCVTSAPPVLAADSSWNELWQQLQNCDVVLIRDDQGLVGMTRIDLLRSLPRLQHTSNHAE
jgi:cystathionine beta-synthase